MGAGSSLGEQAPWLCGPSYSQRLTSLLDLPWCFATSGPFEEVGHVCAGSGPGWDSLVCVKCPALSSLGRRSPTFG